jgi:hypothetical protein
MCRLSVEDEWSKTASDRVLSIDGGPMWFSGLIVMFAQLEIGWAIREKLRIRMGRSLCALFSCSKI